MGQIRQGGRALLLALITTAAMAATACPALAADGPNPAEPDVAPAAGDDSERIPNSYLVVFDDDTSLDHIREVEQEATVRGGRIHVEYTQALRGFGVTMSKTALAAVKEDKRVRFVEADRTVEITSTQTPVPSWGLDRVDQRPATLDGRYAYEATGAGVTAYLIDTGIRATHHEFGGRVAPGYSTVGADNTNTSDCNGHGTHTAATVGGATYGVAKAVTLVPVRVLDCQGGGSIAELVEGIDWVTQQVHDYHQAHPGEGSFIANLSLGQDGSQVIDMAVSNSIAEGITYVVAAGNENGSACTPSPGRVPSAITVGATSSADERASFSNFGSCVDVWAPGVAIKSAYDNSDTGTITLSGTSMAAPHVAGAAALYLERFPASTPAQVSDAITSTATTGVLKNLGAGSPNRLLYAAALGGVANRGPTIGGPVPFLTNGQSTTAGAVPVKVVAAAPVDPDGDAVTSHQFQVSRNGGSTWADVALPSPRATTATLKLPATGALRFRARATDNLGHAGDWINGPIRSLSLHDERSSAAYAKSGRWKGAEPKAALDGAVRRTDRAGAAVTITFTGSQITWIATMAKDRGKAAVYIDGKKIAVIDLFSRAATSRRSVFYATGMSSGKHKLKIVVLGSHRQGAKGNYADVDGWGAMA